MKWIYQGFVAVAYAILLSGPIISCSNGTKAPDVSYDPTPALGDAGDPGTGPDGPDLGSGGGVDSAEIRIAFEEKQLASYVDVNASLTYEFKYLTHEKRGDVTFQNGRAELTFSSLTVGQSGTLTLTMAENGTPALAGEVTGLTLDGGRNEVTITLREVDSGGDDGNDDGGGDAGDDEAELVLQVIIEGAGQTGGDDGGGDDSGGGDTEFAAIQPLAKAACTGCHHADPETAEWWAGSTEKTKSQLERALDGSGSQPMPPPGTRQAAAISAAEKTKLLTYVSR